MQKSESCAHRLEYDWCRVMNVISRARGDPKVLKSVKNVDREKVMFQLGDVDWI